MKRALTAWNNFRLQRIEAIQNLGFCNGYVTALQQFFRSRCRSDSVRRIGAKEPCIECLIAVIDPAANLAAAGCRPAGAQKPRTKGPHRGAKQKTAPFHQPKNKHHQKGEDESPRTGMDQEKESRGKGARVHHKKPDRFSGITPVGIDFIRHKVLMAPVLPRGPRYNRVYESIRRFNKRLMAWWRRWPERPSLFHLRACAKVEGPRCSSCRGSLQSVLPDIFFQQARGFGIQFRFRGIFREFVGFI